MNKWLMILVLTVFSASMLFSFYRIYLIYKPTMTTLQEIEAYTNPVFDDVPKKRITLIIPGIRQEQMALVEKEALASAEALHVHLDIKRTLNETAQELVKEVEVAISSKTDGIILYGVDDLNVRQVINKATKKGIAVITIGNDVPNSLRKTYIGSNHQFSGKIMANTIMEKLDHKGSVGIIGDYQTSFMNTHRLLGMNQSFQEYPSIEVIYPLASNQDRIWTAPEQTNEVLNQYPAIDAFIVLNGNEVSKVVSTIKSRVNKQKHLIYSFDATEEVRELMEESEVEIAIAHDYQQIGAKSMDLMTQWLAAEELPLPMEKYTSIHIIDELDAKEGVASE
ncbi:sugar ABC transporter substrate-binding protein [Gracilibacillus kekensis]|uniref:Ribose transport system substrate-binding protein n=1 Tax=Gracilibacillus kekensis TaxID=1027249 RepID=A0A1M7IQZ7_9BACI|nr:substrate-binding domain-containing protein [Gracilibacillus kekensis]SHM43234.1 ribose transport system substrate-binding protein [Gracilibacillus kekensis]